MLCLDHPGFVVFTGAIVDFALVVLFREQTNNRIIEQTVHLAVYLFLTSPYVLCNFCECLALFLPSYC